MGIKINLINKKFGRLTVVRQVGLNKEKKALWECICDCGNKKITSSVLLRRGTVRSCGCLKVDMLRSTYTKHGHAIPGNHTSEFNTWMNIKDRCFNPKNSHYHSYGGRGIKVCPRWLDSFSNFLEDMGLKPTPSHSIDRENNDGDYEPSNCRWATTYQQVRNRQNNRWVRYNGENLIISDWARRFNTTTAKICYYLKKGHNMEFIENKFNSKCYGKKK